MNRDEFVRRYEPVWNRVEELLERLRRGRRLEHELAELPELYRRSCHHLALARQRRYEAALEARLNRIALMGYRQLYQHQRAAPLSALRRLAVEFPRLVRAHAKGFWLATALFYGAGLAMGSLVLSDPEAIYSLMDEEAVRSFEEMYRVAPQEERPSADDFAMFGFYIYNNVGIAFRTFASGLFAGIGTLFFLTLNGLFLGAVFAHLVHAGGADNLLSFVVTHGAFELTAIVIAGVAGLRLGSAVVTPGRKSRLQALRDAATDGVTLILGVAGMLFLAAFLEAFWSSTAGVSANGKLLAGGVAWASVFLYLSLVGRAHES